MMSQQLLTAALVACLWACSTSISWSTVWHVGPGMTYTTPCAVSGLVQDGDTVRISAGTYSGDVCSWFADSIVLKGAGLVVLDANGKSAEQKAIWVIKGDNCTVDGIEFHNCTVPDRNGAGIRVEGTNITVLRCAFRRNQDGILAGDNANSTIDVEFCEFDNSGAGDGLSHAIYVNHVKHFIFLFNYSHSTKVGHECKSRAFKNDILYNRISSELGTGSRNIDLPNGGRTVIMGNVIQKGPNTENGNVIGYGLEGLSDTIDNSLYVAYNTIVNERSSATFFRLDTNTRRFRLVNNILAGPGTVLVGTADSLDTLNNLRRQAITDCHFFDADNYDYHIGEVSPARRIAVDPGFYDDWSIGDDLISFPLAPDASYEHLCSYSYRASVYDMGCYANDVLDNVDETRSPGTSINGHQVSLRIYPNPATVSLSIATDEVYQGQSINIMDLTGRIIYTADVVNTNTSIDLSGWKPGMYISIIGETPAPFQIIR